MSMNGGKTGLFQEVFRMFEGETLLIEKEIASFQLLLLLSGEPGATLPKDCGSGEMAS
jgi:hypothetical protein